MKMHQLSPILWTKDLAATIKLYTEVLGFSATSNFPNFVTLTNGNAEMMFIVPNEEPEACEYPDKKETFFPKANLTGSIFIYMQEVDEFWLNVKDKAIIKSPIANREYLMRDFSILDNNGYEIVFGEDLAYKKSLNKSA